jgi:hypothetical protein
MKYTRGRGALIKASLEELKAKVNQQQTIPLTWQIDNKTWEALVLWVDSEWISDIERGRVEITDLHYDSDTFRYYIYTQAGGDPTEVSERVYRVAMRYMSKFEYDDADFHFSCEV